MTIPLKCRELIITLMDGGWSFVVQHGVDTGDHPFISIDAVHRRNAESSAPARIRVTWHTRATGTYRLFSCMVNKRDVTLTRALEVVTQ